MDETAFREVADIAIRMLQLAQANGSMLQTEKRADMVRFGEELNKLGSMGAMVMAYIMMERMWQANLLGMPRTQHDFHPAEYRYAWDGVGGWMA